jgi:hypothetical protein
MKTLSKKGLNSTLSFEAMVWQLSMLSLAKKVPIISILLCYLKDSKFFTSNNEELAIAVQMCLIILSMCSHGVSADELP